LTASGIGYRNHQKKKALTPFGIRAYVERQKGFEPSTFGLGSGTHPVASEGSKALTPTPFSVCTRVCTSEAENANADALEAASFDTPQAADVLGTGHPDEGEGTATIDQGDTLAKLAAAVANLSPADRERLAAMLAGQQRGKSRGVTQ
jgi:hypothetical protein